MNRRLATLAVIVVILALAAPAFGVLLNLPAPAYGTLILTLLIGTPALSMIGAFGAARRSTPFTRAASSRGENGLTP